MGLILASFVCVTRYQDTRSCVSGQERHKTHSVLFTGSGKFLISTPCISGTTKWIFIKFTHFMLYIYITLHIKFERHWVRGEQDIHFQKLPNFLHIFHLLFLHTAFDEPHKSNLPMVRFLSNLAHIKVYLSSKCGQF